jgi:hypothetical protein
VELELGRGRGTRRSEAPASSPNRQARGGEPERKMEGGSAQCRVEDGKWEREMALGAARQCGLWGSGWLWVARAEVVAHTRGGGELMNKGGWRARLTGGAEMSRRPSFSGGVREGDGSMRQRSGGAATGGSNSVLNRFKNIQTVQMNFEFL